MFNSLDSENQEIIVQAMEIKNYSPNEVVI